VPNGDCLNEAAVLGQAIFGLLGTAEGVWSEAKALFGLARASNEGGSTIGAQERLKYEGSPKHGRTARGNVSAAPVNGQDALDTSLQIKGTSPRRVGIDYETGDFVVFDQTSEGVFHGHVRAWGDLPPGAQQALRDAGMATRNGKITGTVVW
jgi:hypothetical protein